MYDANASALAVPGKGDQRPFLFLMDVNGGEASLHWINVLLFRGNGLSFNESTAYLLIFNMFYTKQYIWIELFLELKKMLFYERSHRLFATGGIQGWLLIHSYGIRKRQLSVAQLCLKFNDVQAVMWLVKSNVIQVNRYTFSNSK